MGLLKRTFASIGLIALLSVSGTALADELDDTQAPSSDTATVLAEDESVQDPDTTAEDTSESTPEDTATISPEDDADKATDADSEDSPDNSEDSPDNTEATEPAEGEDSNTSDAACEVWVSDGEGFETMTVTIDDEELLSVDTTDKIDQTALLRTFKEEGSIAYLDFIKLFETEPNLSNYHGEQKVFVEIAGQTGILRCADEGKQSAKSAAWRNPYEFTVFFPVVSKNPPTSYLMPLYFDDQILDDSQSFVSLVTGDSKFDRLVDLNGKEISIDEFLAVMAELEASVGDFPKVGEVFGKHTVKFADFENTYSIVTVVYPDKDNADNDATQGVPTSPVSNGQQNSADNNSNSASNSTSSGNAQATSSTNNSPNRTVVRAADMSYRQYLGNSNPGLTPVAPAPSAPSNASVDSADNGDTQKTEAPNLPVTGKNKNDSKASHAAPAENDVEASSSHAALFALAACFGFGIVAAVSVIAIRRLRK